LTNIDNDRELPAFRAHISQNGVNRSPDQLFVLLRQFATHSNLAIPDSIRKILQRPAYSVRRFKENNRSANSQEPREPCVSGF